KLQPPAGRIWEFDESFAKAFESGSWEITTARSTIQVTRKDGKDSWEQLVTPDLAKGEKLGHWMKIGRDEFEFSDDPLPSALAAVSYGWPGPDTGPRWARKRPNRIGFVGKFGAPAPAGRSGPSSPTPTTSPRRSCTRSPCTPAGSRWGCRTRTTAARSS